MFLKTSTAAVPKIAAIDVPITMEKPANDKKNKDILYNIFSLFSEAIEKENITFTFYNLKNNEYYHAHAIYSQYNHSSNINVELNV